MNMVKEGTRWDGGNGKTFVVIHVIQRDGHTWIHYRNDDGSEPKEYSCYEESFVSRFRQLPE